MVSLLCLQGMLSKDDELEATGGALGRLMETALLRSSTWSCKGLLIVMSGQAYSSQGQPA